MDIIDIDTFIIISPSEVGKNLNTLIGQKLQNTYVNKCIKKYGYIIEIKEFSHDNNILISRVNQYMYLKCQVKMLTITPKIGEIYYGTVQIVYPQGIFISLMNIFDTLVPFEYLKREGYTFQNGYFINDKNVVIKQGGIINVKIIDIHYDKKNFNCIAELISEEALMSQLIDTNKIEEDDEVVNEN